MLEGTKTARRDSSSLDIIDFLDRQDGGVIVSDTDSYIDPVRWPGGRRWLGGRGDEPAWHKPPPGQRGKFIRREVR